MKILYILFLLPLMAFADYTLKDGQLVSREEVATGTAQEHYSNILKAHESKDWKTLQKESLIVIKNFPTTPFAKDATYFLGIAYFEQEDYEMANHQFTEYLTQQATPKFFEETIRHKYEIAEKFRGGAKKHLMGLQSMPKWAPAGSEALSIYEEVISALPHHDLAAHALFGKAQIQLKNEDYRASVETFQTLIRRFSKHPLAVEAFVEIGIVYLNQSKTEYPDPDYLDLAELNLRKFRAAFPTEEKLKVATRNYRKMEEHYASNLWETARFYERTNKPGAAKIYYSKIVKSYPDSQYAKRSKERIPYLEAKLTKLESKKAK